MRGDFAREDFAREDFAREDFTRILVYIVYTFLYTTDKCEGAKGGAPNFIACRKLIALDPMMRNDAKRCETMQFETAPVEPGTMLQIRGGVFRCSETSTSLLFQTPQSTRGPGPLHTPFLDYSELVSLIVRESRAKCPGEPFVEPDEFNMGTIVGLWSITTLQEAMESRVLHRSAKLALRRMADKTLISGTTGIVSTQGIVRQIANFSADPHPFGHPNMQRRCVEFRIYPTHPVVCVQMSPVMGSMVNEIGRQKCDHRKMSYDLEDIMASKGVSAAGVSSVSNSTT